MSVVLITLSAALFMQIGYFCWKITADRMKNTPPSQGGNLMRQYIQNPLWMTGMLSTSVGWLLFIKATNIGEISIVQPLMSAGDLFLVVVAIFYLKEKMTAQEWFGIALTIAGAFVLALEAKEIPTEKINYIPLGLFIAATLGLAIYLKISRHPMPAPEITLSLLVGLAFGEGALLTELLTSAESTFLTSTIWQQATSTINLAGVIAANAVGITLLQVAFRHGRAAIVIPAQLATANIIVLLGAHLIFSETINMPRLLGIGCIVVGTGLLYRLNKQEEQI